MTERDSVPELLDVLRNGPVGVSSSEEVAMERLRLVPWLEEQVAALPLETARLRRVRRQRAWAASGAALAAAAAGVALFLTQLPREDAPGPVASDAPGSTTLLSGRLLSGSAEILPGSRLGEASVVESSPEESALLQGGSGFLAELSAGSKLALGAPGADPARQELRLERGGVSLKVPRLPVGNTLSVLTEDARVVVRGTEFSVTLQQDGGVVRTCVRVREGAVEVHRRGFASVVLGSGQESGCEAPSGPSESEERGAARRARPAPSGKSHRAPTSTLTAENELMSSALQAERAGDLPRARRELESLLKRYPASLHVDEARSALQRVKRKQAGADPQEP